VTMTILTCPKCGGRVGTKINVYDKTKENYCLVCNFPVLDPEQAEEIRRLTEEFLTPDESVEEVKHKGRKASKKRFPGLSPTEIRKRWRNSPAGKASVKRYQKSELYRQAHARHRQTESYKATQERFHSKRKMFRELEKKINCKHKHFELLDDGSFICEVCGKTIEEVYG